MNRSRSRHGDNDQETPDEFMEKLDAMLSLQSASNERLERIEQMIAGSQRFAHAVATSEYRRDLREMATFDALNARVTKIADIATAIKTMYDGVKAERDGFKAEVDRLNAADSSDQASVDAAEANLASSEAVLAALTAVAAGTPVGGSMANVPV